MRVSGWKVARALLRLPAVCWHLGRAGVLGHVRAKVPVPGWMRPPLGALDLIVRSRHARRDAGGALADALVRLGPGFIKLGQALSTRADLIGPELAHSLSQLQDRLDPFPARVARKQIGVELGGPLEDVFSSFEDKAVAAASVAQVHRARLKGGREVAVKLLRPNIRRRIMADTSLFFGLAAILEWLAPDLRRLRLVTAVEQFRHTSDIELDLRLEAAAAGRLADNMANEKGVHVPWVDLGHTTAQMLVIEWVDGVRIDDVEALARAGHDIAKITQVAARSFFNQVFRDGFFHADMHPGNIFIAPDGRLVPIDFGIMGHLDFADRLFLARLLTALLEADYDQVARLHAEAGMLGRHVSQAQFAQAVRALGEPVTGKAIGEISLGMVLGQILQLSTRFHVAVQPQYNLLQKSMMMAEGVARQLNPKANMWLLAQPLAAEWMQNEANAVRRVEQLAHDTMVALSRLPQLIESLERNAETPTRRRGGGLCLAVSLIAAALALVAIFAH